MNLKLSRNEKELIDYVHEFMSYTDKLIKAKNGQVIPNVNYKEIPYGSTILLFGGYKMIGFHAADSMKAYYAKYKKWPEIMITGKSSNKIDNTAGLGSEVNAYQYILENCGIPQKVVRKNYIEPIDTSTAENTQSVDKILRANVDLQEKPIVIFTQPYYARRALHDFLAQMPNKQFLVANLPKPDFEKGLFYNDRADGNAIDVMMGACFYQSMYNQARWEKGETIAPTNEELASIPTKEEIKPILERYCGWLYPNNMMDLGLAEDLQTGKRLIEERKKQLLSQKEFSSEQQFVDIRNAVANYRIKNGLVKARNKEL